MLKRNLRAAIITGPRSLTALSQVAWGSSKSIGDTTGYKIGGWGVTAGAEVRTLVGKFGASLNYLWGKDGDRAIDNALTANQYSLAVHWRLRRGGFQVSAGGSYAHLGHVKCGTERRKAARADTTQVTPRYQRLRSPAFLVSSPDVGSEATWDQKRHDVRFHF